MKGRIKVARQNPVVGREKEYESFDVPDLQGETVLAALQHVYENIDHDLAFRYYCRMGKCGQCAVTVNGKPCLACITKAEREMIIEPLARLPVIKDLVVDRQALLKRYSELQPTVERARPPDKQPEAIDLEVLGEYIKLTDCAQCLACVSACPKYAGADGEFAGPLGMLWLAQRAIDPRDEADRVRMALEHGLMACDLCGKCREACPRKINIPKLAIARLRKLAKNRGERITKSENNES